MRLLVVEDETRIVELLRSAFERAGFVVDAVGTTTEGDQALSLFRDSTPAPMTISSSPLQ